MICRLFSRSAVYTHNTTILLFAFCCCWFAFRCFSVFEIVIKWSLQLCHIIGWARFLCAVARCVFKSIHYFARTHWMRCFFTVVVVVAWGIWWFSYYACFSRIVTKQLISIFLSVGETKLSSHKPLSHTENFRFSLLHFFQIRTIGTFFFATACLIVNKARKTNKRNK